MQHFDSNSVKKIMCLSNLSYIMTNYYNFLFFLALKLCESSLNLVYCTVQCNKNFVFSVWAAVEVRKGMKCQQNCQIKNICESKTLRWCHAYAHCKAQLYIPSTLNIDVPYTVVHTIDCVCTKMLKHGLNHGFFLSLFRLVSKHSKPKSYFW